MGKRSACKAGRDRDSDFMFHDSCYEGWVWKRSRYLKRWRRRYLVLRAGQLMSFKSRGGSGKEATEIIPVAAITNVLVASQQLQQTRVFSVQAGKREFLMVCDFEADRDAWLSELTEATEGRATALPSIEDFIDMTGM